MTDSAFDAWYNEIEGFALRAERLTGPKAELMAAFEAGRQDAAIEALADMTGKMWVAGRDEFVKQADRFNAADRHEMASAIADRAPEHIVKAMLSEARSPSLKEQEEGN